jgi:hypothetical protein
MRRERKDVQSIGSRMYQRKRRNKGKNCIRRRGSFGEKNSLGAEQRGRQIQLRALY